MDEPFEFLRTPADLDDWFTQAGMRTAGAASGDADLAAAVELREAIYTLAWHRLNREELPQAALDVLNSAAADNGVALALGGEGIARVGDSRQCQADLAREAIDVLGASDAELLRECARDDCTQIYRDRSRGHRREWCSMQTCGNRAKAAAYRARRRDEGERVSEARA